MAITAPRGTQDFLPEQTAEWQMLEAKIRRICALYEFGEIRTPLFENTELFLRGIGETTDVVTKEMYTFVDRGGIVKNIWRRILLISDMHDRGR